MKTPKRILFITQDMHPFLPVGDDLSGIRMRNRRIPETFIQNGYESRVFMPKWGEVNDRRQQLHEVIRLSGQNVSIADSVHPVVLKVSNVLPSRMQVYFIDNEDLFGAKHGLREKVDAATNNDERCIFFCRGVLETVKKQCWEPNIIYCSGWMAALIPLYLRRCYTAVPFLNKAKIVVALDDQTYAHPFPSTFADKVLFSELTHTDVRDLNGFNVDHELLMRLAIEHADGVVCATANINPRLISLAQTKDKPLLEYNEEDSAIFDFCLGLLPAAEL